VIIYSRHLSYKNGDDFMDYYTMNIAGLERKLPLCKISRNLYIAAFIIFGDVEITQAAATELLKRAPEYDVLITAESKGIPLIYEMARQAVDKPYIVARKAAKLYMQDIFTVHVKSITTENVQTLCVDGSDVEKMRGKRVLIVDDVISTGASLTAIEELVESAGGIIAGRMAVLAEGDACKREDITYLEQLPLFNAKGEPIFR
jgi:adenine phosphoribosyltransferase